MSRHSIRVISGPVPQQNTSSASQLSGKRYCWNGIEETEPFLKAHIHLFDLIGTVGWNPDSSVLLRDLVAYNRERGE